MAGGQGTVGELLRRGKPLDEILATMHMVAEGVGTARIALSLGERYQVELPICAGIYKWSWASSTRSTPPAACEPPATRLILTGTEVRTGTEGSRSQRRLMISR